MSNIRISNIASLLLLATLLIGAMPATARAQEAAASPTADLEQKAHDVLHTQPGAIKATITESVMPELPVVSTTIDLARLDENKDGILARDEVGAVLFSIYDQDSTKFIDNIEYEEAIVSTVVPMKKTTVEIVEFGDNSSVKKEVSSEEFMETSGLAAFSNGKDGLSARSFLGKSFSTIDIDKDKVISPYELKRAYAARVRPLHYESFIYND